MLKKIISFLYPITIFKKQSAISSQLEITWVNGELVLDSKNTNYSFGSLQRILRKGLQEIGFATVAEMNSVLLLGVGGGSVLHTLKSEIKTKAAIIGVEIDPEVIELAKKYFTIDQLNGVSIVIEDAFDYVLKHNVTHDLIIIDIFQDTTMPNFLFETFFANRICSLLAPQGYILFNTMVLTKEAELRNDSFCEQIDPVHFSVKRVPKIDYHNEVIIIQRK